MSPKPVFERMHNLIKGEWWTRSEGRTNAEGEWPVRAFYGVHRIEVELPGGRTVKREVTWKKDAPNRVEMVVA